jgi:hypothetical protein
MESYDPTKLYLVTDKNRMLIMNDGFEIQGIVDLEQLYTLCLWTDNRKFLTRDKETILINHENKKIAVLQISPNALLVGKKLYDIQDKSFLELDLSGLVGEEN